MSKYKDTYEVLVHMANTKMVMNSHKGNIENIPTNVLITKAIDELMELEQAISSGNTIHVIEEAADVTNFVVAAVHNAIQSYRGKRNVENTRHTESTGHQKVDDSKDGSKSVGSGTHVQRCDDCKGDCGTCKD